MSSYCFDCTWPDDYALSMHIIICLLVIETCHPTQPREGYLA